jgi:hypoxanthine phosphoribosyltransferase
MSSDLPAGFPADSHVIFTATEIDAILARMAREIADDLAASNPIVIPVLLGGAFTAMRLMQHFEFGYEMDSVRIARYGHDRRGSQVHWYARPCLELDGRHILLVDDILDRGVTLHAVEHELKRMNAASVSSAVLIRKIRDVRVERPAVDYVGADAPDEFLFGCGMDLEGRWRGLPALYAVDRGRDSKRSL